MNGWTRRILAATVAVGLVLASAAFVQASPILGNYQGPGMFNGRWSESFNGGGESNIGNVIKGASWDGATLGSQWVLAAPVLTSDALVSDQTFGGLEVKQFYTVYAGGNLTLKSGPWTAGGDGNYIVDITSFSQSTIVTLFLGNVLNVTGAVSMTGTIEGFGGAYSMNYLSATTTIDGAGAAAPATYPSLVVPAGEWGSATSVQMQIVPEPATLALLALGFGGMTILRRRRKQS